MSDAAALVAECERLLADPRKPTVPEVAPLVRSFYALPGNGTGGLLHVVLDDLNTRNVFVDDCILTARRVGDRPAELLGLLLRRMSRTQRGKLAGLVYQPPGEP